MLVMGIRQTLGEVHSLEQMPKSEFWADVYSLLRNNSRAEARPFASRAGVEAASPLATVAVVALTSWSTKDSSGWDTARRPSVFYQRSGARRSAGQPTRSHRDKFCEE
jgi:hypothetical protein